MCWGLTGERFDRSMGEIMARARSQNKKQLVQHPVAVRRRGFGWSQEELAARAGMPRSSVSAIEAGRLTPSVTAALVVARALGCSVEELFQGEARGRACGGGVVTWAWTSQGGGGRFWEAEVGGRNWLYPVEALPGSSWAHDGVCRGELMVECGKRNASETLVLAGCDPAAGLLAAGYAAASGFRLLAFPRGGAAALELLREGVVHVAALHRSTVEQPERNAETVRERLGEGYRLLRCAVWQEGIALPAGNLTPSVEACAKGVKRWAMREPGSAARECLDELLGGKGRDAKQVLLSHQAVAEAVRAGWAEAGVCVQLCAEDAGLRFLPVRSEALDLCFPAAMANDARIQALISLLRSGEHRRLIGDLPGYDVSGAGEIAEA